MPARIRLPLVREKLRRSLPQDEREDDEDHRQQRQNQQQPPEIGADDGELLIAAERPRPTDGRHYCLPWAGTHDVADIGDRAIGLGRAARLVGLELGAGELTRSRLG